MNIKNTFFFTGLQTGLKILSGLIMNKIIAVYLGPAGLALLGQFQNFITVVFTFSNGSIQTGIVKYTADYNVTDQILLKKMMKNALFLSVVFSVVSSLIIFIWAPRFSVELMYTVKYSYIFYFLGFSIVFYSLNLYALSIFNGLGEIRLYTLLNIILSVITLFISIFLTMQFGLAGSLVALVSVQFMSVGITILFTYKKYKFIYNFYNIWKNIDYTILRNLLSYSAASLSSGIMVSISAIYIRSIVQKEFSLDFAGDWEAASRIGLYYNLIFMTSFVIHYLPKLSASKNKEETRNYLVEAFRFFLPFMILSVMGMFFFREFIIRVLFSEVFIPMESLLVFIGLGALFSVLAMMLDAAVLAKKNIILSMISSCSYNVMLVILCFVMMKSYGFIGLGYGFFCAALFSFCLSIYLYKIQRKY